MEGCVLLVAILYLTATPPASPARYTPAQQGVAYNSGAKQRIIRMVEAQKDPMEPPRFKTNTKIPRGPPSPPAPVLHSPTRKVTLSTIHGCTDNHELQWFMHYVVDYALHVCVLVVSSLRLCVSLCIGYSQGTARVENTTMHL